MFCNEATAASAAAASGSTKLLRSGIFARRLTQGSRPVALSWARKKGLLDRGEQARGLARLGAAQRCARVVWRRIWPAARFASSQTHVYSARARSSRRLLVSTRR